MGPTYAGLHDAVGVRFMQAPRQVRVVERAGRDRFQDDTDAPDERWERTPGGRYNAHGWS
jgi:hypothetical protein